MRILRKGVREMGNRLRLLDAAKFMGCGKDTLYRLKREGLMEGTYFNMGNKTIFFEDKLLEWMQNGGEDGAKARRKERRQANENQN